MVLGSVATLTAETTNRTPFTPRNFTTPAAAIETIIRAYQNNDLETAALCMDFKALAAYRMSDKYPRPTPEAIAAEADRFERHWRGTLAKHGLPSYKGFKVEEVKKPIPQKGGYRVDFYYVCPQSSGRVCLKMTQTVAGWRFIYPPNRSPYVDDNRPFPVWFN